MNTAFLRFLSATIDHAVEVIEEYEPPQRRQLDFMGHPVQISLNQEIPDSALEVLAAAQECFGSIDKIEKAFKK